MHSHTSRRSLAVLVLAVAFAVASLGYAMVVSKRSQAAPQARLTTLRVAPAADTFVAANAPGRTNGALGRLAARADTGKSKVSYLKFWVSRESIGDGRVVSARLVLKVKRFGQVPVTVRAVRTSSWSEDAITYRSAPDVGSVVGVVEPNGQRRRAVDVSRVVTGPGLYSFALTTAAGRAWFHSSESARSPRLRVTVLPTDGRTTTGGSQACWRDFPGQPCAGEMYYGATVEGGDPRQLEGQVGDRLSLHRWYMTSTNKASAFGARAAADVAAGRLPLISTKVPGSWSAMAAGRHDDWLLDRIRALAAVDGPVWLALHHEPRGDGPPADWVDMQQHARKLIQANSDNIALVGILNGWDFLERGGNPEAFDHPVGTGVDIMGFDSYNPWSPTNGKEWKSVETAMSPGLVIQSWGYPTLIGETGVRTDPRNPGRAAAWLRDQYSYGVQHRFLGIAYFHSSYQSPDGSWVLSGERLNQFRNNLERAETARIG